METPPTKRLRSAFKPTTQLHYSHVLDVLKQDNCFKNLVFSPICLKLGLAIIYLGAEGETAKQIERFFGENVTKDDIHAFLFDGLASLSKIHKDIDLKLANQLFISKNYQILDSFTEKLKKFEQNFIEKVDDHEFSEKIDDFLQEFFEGGNSGSFTNENDIDDETKLIFLNSIFFKANWFQIFVAAATEDSDFHVTESKTITVKMMKAEDDFYYRQGNHFQVLGIPMENPKFVMFFVLPEKNLNLDEFLENFDEIELEKVLKINKKEKCFVRIPKFRIESENNVVEDLEKFGVVDLFDQEKCDLSGMVGESKEIYLKKILQKLFIVVNEEGVKAGTVYTMFGALLAGRKRKIPPEFIADHPFFYFIVHREKNSRTKKEEINILFSGIVVEPSFKTDDSRQKITKKQCDFSLKFLQTSNFVENSIISPFSVFLEFLLIGFGSTNWKEIYEFFGENVTKFTIFDHFLEVWKEFDEVQEYACLEDGENIQLLPKIIIPKSGKILESFLKNFKNYFSKRFEKLNFDDYFCQNDDQLNNKKNLKKIPSLILKNMINFNISWVRGFFNDGIHDFFLKDGTKKQVEMFVADSLCQFVENDDFYLFGQFLMDGSSLLYIILPKENKNLENILENLETEKLYNLIRFAEAEVKKIRIPKFVIESETDLSERLKKMGMEFVFDSQEWNFDKMCENYENLHISSILQNLSINVNVKGIGHNIVHENEPLSEEGVHEITVNRPFVYMLVTKCREVMWIQPEHFNIILTGVVYDPIQNT